MATISKDFIWSSCWCYLRRRWTPWSKILSGNLYYFLYFFLVFLVWHHLLLRLEITSSSGGRIAKCYVFTLAPVTLSLFASIVKARSSPRPRWLSSLLTLLFLFKWERPALLEMRLTLSCRTSTACWNTTVFRDVRKTSTVLVSLWCCSSVVLIASQVWYSYSMCVDVIL